MPRALAVTYGGGHVNLLVPVFRELERRGDWATTVLGLTTAGGVLKEAGIPAIGFRDLVSPREDEAALERGRELAERGHHSPESGIPLEESIAYLGLSYVDLERRVGPREAARRFEERGRACFLPLGPLERLIRRVKPDVVIATNSPRAEEAALKAAGSLGVRTVCVTDPFALDPINSHVTEPGIADRVTVFSEEIRKVMIERGAAPGCVIVTGNPAFDRLSDPDLARKSSEWRRRRGVNGRKVILWASQRDADSEDTRMKVLQTLVEMVRMREDRHLIYRPHPNESILPVTLHGRAYLSGREEDLPALLGAVDVAVTMASSTVILEALLMDKPVIRVCPSDLASWCPADWEAATCAVRGAGELVGRIEEVFSGGPLAGTLSEARRRLVPTRQAARNVADVIEECAGAPRLQPGAG